MSDWAGERYLDIRKVEELRAIMGKRMDIAVEKGCDAVEPDNIDIYTHPNTGFNLTKEHQIAYNIMLSEEAHKRNLSIGLKNALLLVPVLEKHFDWVISESCFTYNECHHLQPFADAGKAVFQAEYELNKVSRICDYNENFQFSVIVKERLLTPRRESCD